MPIPRLRIDESALLVIDMQERMAPTIGDWKRICHHCAILLRMAGELGIPALVTEHYPRGLGRTVDVVAAAMIDPAARIEKTRFSAMVDLVDEQLRQWQRRSVIVCGIEAHVCVLQAVLDLQQTGRQCFVALDAISGCQPEQVGPAIRRMERAGAVSSGVMSMMYELMEDARHPSFNALLELAKDIWKQ
jgi:nicotinamidase-related amidase